MICDIALNKNCQKAANVVPTSKFTRQLCDTVLRFWLPQSCTVHFDTNGKISDKFIDKVTILSIQDSNYFSLY